MLQPMRRIMGLFCLAAISLALIISSQPVRAEEVPRFVFGEVSFTERRRQATSGLAVLALYNLVFFAGAYWSFRTYDVR